MILYYIILCYITLYYIIVYYIICMHGRVGGPKDTQHGRDICYFMSIHKQHATTIVQTKRILIQQIGIYVIQICCISSVSWPTRSLGLPSEREQARARGSRSHAKISQNNNDIPITNTYEVTKTQRTQ